MKKRILLICALLVSVITLSGAANRSLRIAMEQWNPIGITQASNGITQAQSGPQTTNRLTAGSAILPMVATTAPSGVLRGGSTNMIAFTTNKKIGEKLSLTMRWDTDAAPTLSGLDGTPQNNRSVTYTITAPVVMIRGDVNLFECAANELTGLDVSQNSALTRLDCSNNKLTALNLSQNSALTNLVCQVNELTALDVSENTALTWFSCYANKLTELDVSKNTELEQLYCEYNQLTALYLTKNTELTELWCDNNHLATLDLSMNTKLKKLKCSSNQLTALDVSPLNELEELRCYGNQIKGKEMTRLINSLPDLSDKDAGTIVVVQEPSPEGNLCLKSDVSIAKDKQWITYLYDNNLGQIFYYEGANTTSFTTAKAIGENVKLKINYTGPISISGLSGTPRSGEYVTYTLTAPTVTIGGNVTDLFCSDNKLTALDLSQNSALKVLECSKNRLTALNVFQNLALVHLYCSDNLLTALDLSTNTALTELECHINQLTALDVSKNTKLEKLNCSNNRLPALDPSQNSALTELRCSANRLTALDPSQNSALTELRCSANPLTALDPSQNSALTELDCFGCLLTALDPSKNTALTNLNCGGNRLTALDVSKNTSLKALNCGGNRLTALDVSKNTLLTLLECSDNQLTTLDLSQNHALYRLECYQNQIKGEEMTRVVNSLPDRTGKDFGTFVVTQDLEPEGNVCLKSDVAIAEGKNWNTYMKDLYTDDLGSYEGEDPIPYAVTLTKEGEGTLTATGAADLNAVPEGTELTIVATPAAGYELTALTANDTDILATKKFTVRAATEVKATFAKKTYAVTLTKEGEGTLTATGADDLKAVPEGTELTIEAMPADGYELKALTANGEDILATKKFTVTAATEVKATFAKKTYAVTLTKEGEGTLTATGATDLNAVPYGTELTIGAMPAAGYELTALTANDTDILATKKFTVTAATEVKATFTKKTYAVTFTKVGEGTLAATGATDLNAVPYGTELTVEAMPAAGYELTALTANGADILATKKVVVKGATEVKAIFTKKTAADIVESSSLRLYPNPASAYVNVKAAKADALVRLYDAKGALRYEARTDADGTLQIDLSAYAEGTYLLRVGDDAQRLLIQR